MAAARVNAMDGGLADAADYLERMFAGMGDEVIREQAGSELKITQRGLRALRGLAGAERALVLECWAELWQGACSAQGELKGLNWEDAGHSVVWRLGIRAER